MEGYVHPDFGLVTEKLDKVMRGRRSFGGAAVAVYHQGELVVDAWTGESDAAGTPWQRDTMAMSFSTTKGVVATVVHRLVDRGVLSYDEPVATYWPEFAAAGKQDITLHHLLTHQAAMHDVRNLVPSGEALLDWDDMVQRLAAAEPSWEPGLRPGYHGLTYGWLVGEVIRRVTGLTVNEAVQREVAQPLGIDGLFVGAPPEQRLRTAQLLVDEKQMARLEKGFDRLQRFERMQPLLDALAVDDFLDISLSEQILDAEVPAANGVFTARSLARMYAALATPQHFDHQPLVSADTLEAATAVQTNQRDVVVGMKMRWRLGYHLAATSSGVV
ncbi:MAG: serine hydrolase domain-containing protein, partial [Acidimicrobiales bacterium]